MRRAPRAARRLIRRAVLLLALAAASCGGLPRAGKAPESLRAPSYELMKLEELRALSDSDPRAYLAAFAAIRGKAAGLDPASLDDFARGALATIVAGLPKAEEGKDYPLARELALSLAAASALPSLAPLLSAEASAIAAGSSAIVARLYAEEAEEFFGRSLSTPAFLLYERALASGRAGEPGFDAAELSRWAARALAAGSRPSLGVFASALEKAGLAPPEGAAAFLASRDSLSLMSKGVVTVRVDKGMKIEQGVGVPDRVLGSAFFIDASGYLLTNYHVIESEVDPKYEGYSRLNLRVAEDPEARIAAKVVGWDRLLDLALLKADVKPGYVFSLSRDAGLEPGDRILAIGSPVGLESTMTSGIVSAVGRDLLQVGEAIQVDAALNPGNSGGPLLDEAGQVAGIVFAGLPQYQNLNFAIPSPWILGVLPGLFRGGELQRAWLGLALAERGGGLDVTYRHPGAAAGVEAGDRLLSIDGIATCKRAPAQALLADHEPGGLSILRLSGQEGERPVLRLLGKRPFSPIEEAFGKDSEDRLLAPLFGIEARRQPGSVLEPDAFSIARIWPGTIADEAGLSENDPFALRRFYLDREQRAAVIQIRVKKRKAGFLESILQIPAPIDIPDFI